MLRSEAVWVIGLTLTLAIAGLFVANVACSNPDGAAPTRSRTAQAPSQPPPTTQILDGSTWVLQMLDGSPPIGGTFAWIKVDGHTFSGFDSCNTVGGKSEDGTTVASGDGEFTIPPSARTDIGCEFPLGIMDQADSYLELLKHGKTFRVVDDLLEILDEGGQTRLVFARQVPLPGRPLELAGTEWQLAVEDSAGGDVKAATLVFLYDRLAVGMK